MISSSRNSADRFVSPTATGRRWGMFLLALLCLSVSTWAHALGLGQATVNSYLNEPLSARIDLISRSEAEMATVTAAMASPADFQVIGLTRDAIAIPIEFTVNRDLADPHIRMTSTQVMTEPVLQLVVEVVWSSGRMLRQYTLFFDPPSFDAPAPLPATASSAGRPAPAAGAPQKPVPLTKAPAPLPPAIAAVDAPAAETVPFEPDTGMATTEPVEAEPMRQMDSGPPFDPVIVEPEPKPEPAPEPETQAKPEPATTAGTPADSPGESAPGDQAVPGEAAPEVPQTEAVPEDIAQEAAPEIPQTEAVPEDIAQQAAPAGEAADGQDTPAAEPGAVAAQAEPEPEVIAAAEEAPAAPEAIAADDPAAPEPAYRAVVPGPQSGGSAAFPTASTWCGAIRCGACHRTLPPGRA